MIFKLLDLQVGQDNSFAKIINSSMDEQDEDMLPAGIFCPPTPLK